MKLPEPQRISMEFQDAKLKDILKIFSEQTGINVIASGDIGDQPVTLFFEDVTALDALDQILRAGNLTYERLPGSDIYVVKPIPEEKEEPAPPPLLTRIYRLKYARVSASVLARAAQVFGGRTPFEASLTQASGGSAGGGPICIGRAGGYGASPGSRRGKKLPDPGPALFGRLGKTGLCERRW